jgi:hypothetical protein
MPSSTYPFWANPAIGEFADLSWDQESFLSGKQYVITYLRSVKQLLVRIQPNFRSGSPELADIIVDMQLCELGILQTQRDIPNVFYDPKDPYSAEANHAAYFVTDFVSSVCRTSIW